MTEKRREGLAGFGVFEKKFRQSGKACREARNRERSVGTGLGSVVCVVQVKDLQSGKALKYLCERFRRGDQVSGDFERLQCRPSERAEQLHCFFALKVAEVER